MWDSRVLTRHTACDADADDVGVIKPCYFGVVSYIYRVFLFEKIHEAD